MLSIRISGQMVYSCSCSVTSRHVALPWSDAPESKMLLYYNIKLENVLRTFVNKLHLKSIDYFLDKFCNRELLGISSKLSQKLLTLNQVWPSLHLLKKQRMKRNHQINQKCQALQIAQNPVLTKLQEERCLKPYLSRFET